MRRILAGIRRELEVSSNALASAQRAILARQRAQFEQRIAQLQALSPVAVLERGYALVFDPSGHLLKDAAQVNAGDEISARLARGKLDAVVKKSTPEG